MLQVLKNIDALTVQKIYVDLTNHFLPQPFDYKRSYEGEEELYLSALAEIRNRTNVSEKDNSEKAVTKILSFLSNEISNYVLTPDRKKKAKERVAEIGALPLRDYNLKFDPNFKYFEALGVSESYVKSVVSNPDQLYHAEDIRIPSTLIASRIEPGPGKEAFVLLCHARRHKEFLTINSAWRIYETDIKSSAYNSLLDLLKAFVNKYGFYVQLLNSDRTKFIDSVGAITYDLVRPYVLNRRNFIQLEDKTRYFSNAMVRRSPTGYTELFYVFAIDVDKYIDALLRFGVNVDINFIKGYRQSYYDFYQS